MGVPTSSPNWVSERPSSSFIPSPMIEKIVQTAKQIVKASVLAQSAVRAPSEGVVSSCIGDLLRGATSADVRSYAVHCRSRIALT